MKIKNNSLLNHIKFIQWDKGIFIIILSIVILIPIVVFPYSINVFTPPKELLLEILTLYALTIWILKSIFIDKFSWQFSYLDRPVFLYLLVGCFSLIWSVNIYHSIMALPLFLAAPLLYFLITNSIKEKTKIERIILVIIIVGMGVSIYGLLQYMGIDFVFLADNKGRMEMFSLFGNVNYFAEYLILPLSLCFGLIISRKSGFNSIFLLMALVIMGLTLLLTFTRSSYLGIALSFLLILFFHLINAGGKLQKKYYLKLIFCLILLSIIALAVIYIPNPLNQRDNPLALLRNRLTLESLTSGDSILRRIAIWKFTWMMIEDYPILGSGLGTYDYQTLKYQAEFFARGNNRDIYPHGFAVQAHNEYLQLWSELGIVGLLLFMCIIFTYYKNILKNIKRMDEKEKTITIGLVGGVAAVLVDAFFGFPLQLPASISLFWIFLGLTSAQLSIATSDNKVYIYQNHKNQENIKLENISSINHKHNDINIFKKLFLSVLVIIFMTVSVLFLIRPFLSRVYWYYGNQQIILENYNPAIKLYEKGLKWNPWQGEMYYDIGNILANKGINKTALEYFHKAEKYVDHHKLPQNIAITYLKLGDIKAAIPYLEKTIKYQSDKEEMLPFQLELGNIYLLQKDYSNAERLFKEIITNNPDNFETYYVLAGLYINQGKREQAIKALEKVIEIAPESKEAGYAKTTLTKLEQEK